MSSSVQDQDYMKLAMQLAKKGLGKTWPNPMVGAVVVQQGKIVGQGWHKRYGAAHAEIMALKQAGSLAKDAKLYITLEPCCHVGQTPPCTHAIIKAKIKTVIAAMKDPNPKVSGKGFKELKQANISVQTGVLEKDALELNRVFIKRIKTGLPYIISKAAISIDGKIADAFGNSKWITSESARKKAHQLRAISQAILIGSGTALADDPLLTVRDKKLLSKDQPLRIIIEGKRMISPTSQLVKSSKDHPLMIVTTKPLSKHKLYQHPHVELWSSRGTDQKVDMLFLLKELATRGISLIMIEGGSLLQASVFGTTKKQTINLVDEIYWFVAPKILGGQAALSVVGGDRGLTPNSAIKVNIKTVNPIGQDWLIHGMIGR